MSSLIRNTTAASIWMTVTALATPAMAHEGHGDPSLAHSILHYVLEPVHLPMALAVAAGIVLVLGKLARRVRRVDDAEPAA